MEALHLAYHYVRDGKAPGPNCSPDRLRAQIKVLKEHGFEIMTCGEVAARINSGEPLPEKHATLSFDDGLKDQVETAFPILHEENVPATFFYITNALDFVLPPVIGFQILIDKLGADRLSNEILPKSFAGTPYLDIIDPKRYDATDRKVGEPEEMRVIKWMFNHWPSQSFKREKLDEMFAEYLGEGTQEKLARDWFISEDKIVELHQAGMEIASHTVTHPPLDVTGLSEIEQELRESKNRLESVIGMPIDTFGWTFGGKIRPAAKALAAQHYRSGWNFYGSLVPITYSNVYDIPRFNEQLFPLNEI